MNKKVTILYVDKEVNNINSFIAIFRREYNILSASSAADAFEILNNHIVHIVISDLYLLETDGWKFLSGVTQRHRKCTCILVSDYPLSVSPPGFQIYKKMTKPWDEEEFRIILQKGYDLFLLKDTVMSSFW
jgi:DNA-binding NtrC family response regulator